jgi:hypothetical protein
MAKYTFSCNTCNLKKNINMNIKEYRRLKEEKHFESMPCDQCSSINSFSQLFGNLSSTITKDREQLVRDILDDARAVSEKIRSGDQKAIRNIYGED